MNKIRVHILAIASIGVGVLFAGCAAGGVEPAAKILAEVNGVATGSLQTRPAVVEVAGTPAILYANKSDRVVLQIGRQSRLLDETARVKQGPGYFQLHAQGRNVQALWWSHMSGKNIYFASSTDGGQNFAPASMVNDEHGVLPPYSLTSGGDGVFGMVYHDERLPGYQAYANRSTDGGLTWSRPDQRIDTPPVQARSTDVQETQSVQVGAVWLAAWTETVNVDGAASYRIVSRRSEDAGLTWSPPEILHRAGRQLSSLVVRAQGNSVVMAADELEHGILALVSTDAGRNWRNSGLLVDSEKVSNSGIELAIAGERAHFAWMLGRTDEKVRIMRASLDIAQAKWIGSAKRLNTKPFENTGATMPSIVATTKGQLFAAWMDYRDIRPGIYVSTSHNRGDSWSEPQPLLKQGEVSAGRPQLLQWSDQAAIGYEVYPQDRLTEGNFVVQMLQASDGGQGVAGMSTPMQVTEAQRQARLEQRIKELWNARVKGDYEAAYDFFDFAYKAVTTKKQYAGSAGVIIYHSYTPAETRIEGNEASANGTVKYEVPPTFIPSVGKPIAVPATESEAPTSWVWVGSDWYLVYKPSFDKPLLNY